MLAFVQQVLAFITFEVLEPNWFSLEAKLEKVTTVDQLLRDHVDFLDTCMKACMLTSSKLIKVCVCVPQRRCLVFVKSLYLRLGWLWFLGVFEIDSGVPNVRVLFIIFHEICESGYRCCRGGGS